MYEFDAIGTHWWLERLDGGEFSSAVQGDVADYTAEFDRRYSRFRDDSLVAELAKNGILNHPPEEMLRMLEFARALENTSEGAFSVLVGNVLQDLGYGHLPTVTTAPDHTVGLSENTKRPKHLRQKEGSVVWSEREVVVPPGTVLDMGGLGKGWLIDEYVRILRSHGLKQFIVNGGGDVYCQSELPVSFALEHPYNPSQKIGNVSITRGALAASSTVKRAWRQGKELKHHIIDPTAGQPSGSGVVASFVLASTALVADSLATVLIVRPELESRLCDTYHAKAKLVSANTAGLLHSS